MDLVLKTLSIQSLIIMSRTNQLYNILTQDRLKSIPDHIYVNSFMKVDSTVYRGTLDHTLTIDYLKTHYDVTPYNTHHLVKFKNTHIAIFSNHVTICTKGYKIHLKSLFNIDFEPIYNIFQINMKSHFTVKNPHPISFYTIHQYMTEFFPDNSIIQVFQNRIKIQQPCRFNILIEKNKIRCFITCDSFSLARINYEFVMNIIKMGLYHNNMDYYARKNKIELLREALKHDRSTYFIKGWLGQYMINILNRKYDEFFDTLVVDKRIMLDKYRKVSLIKNKLVYRFWLLKNICQNKIVNDNVLDIIHDYRLIL